MIPQPEHQKPAWRFRKISDPSMRVNEVIKWEWIALGRIKWTLVHAQYPLTNEGAAQFRCLADTLITTFPRLLYEPIRDGDLRVKVADPQPQHTYTLDETHVWHSHTLSVPPQPYRHTCASDVVKIVHQHIQRPSHLMAVQPHPLTSRMCAIWIGHRRWGTSNKDYRTFCARRRAAQGKILMAAGHAKWLEEDEEIALALQTVKWTRLLNIREVYPQDTRRMLRLKHHRVELYDIRNKRRGCPAPDCVADPAAATHGHVFWECPNVILLWKVMLEQWRRVGLEPQWHEAGHIFKLQLPHVPANTWHHLQEVHPDMTLQVEERFQNLIPAVLGELWVLAVIIVIRRAWLGRTAYFSEDGDVPNAVECVATLRTQLSAGYTAVRLSYLGKEHGRERAEIAAAAQFLMNEEAIQRPPLPPRADPGTIYLFFFDGGSRGNPGPGGSGAVIVRLNIKTSAREIIWISCISLSHRTTTNNVAEYRGLVTGLARLEAARLQPSHVIGDSSMILTQQRNRRSAKAPRLKRVAAAARRAADRLEIVSWRRHYRTYNKMADKLANIAMDTRRSTQFDPTSTQHEGFPTPDISQYLSNDVDHWLMTGEASRAMTPAAWQR